MGHTDDNRYNIRHVNVARPDAEEMSIRHHCGIRGEDITVPVTAEARELLRQAAAIGEAEFAQVFDAVIDPSFPRSHSNVMRTFFLDEPSTPAISSRFSTWLASIKQTFAGIRKATR